MNDREALYFKNLLALETCSILAINLTHTLPTANTFKGCFSLAYFHRISKVGRDPQESESNSCPTFLEPDWELRSQDLILDSLCLCCQQLPVKITNKVHIFMFLQHQFSAKELEVQAYFVHDVYNYDLSFTWQNVCFSAGIKTDTYTAPKEYYHIKVNSNHQEMKASLSLPHTDALWYCLPLTNHTLFFFPEDLFLVLRTGQTLLTDWSLIQ